MGIRYKKAKKCDLLEMRSAERIQLIKKARERLRENVVEAKLWQSFVEAENFTINGRTICSGDIDLKGLCLSDLSRGV
jgi:hypothetical protein